MSVDVGANRRKSCDIDNRLHVFFFFLDCMIVTRRELARTNEHERYASQPSRRRKEEKNNSRDRDSMAHPVCVRASESLAIILAKGSSAAR